MTESSRPDGPSLFARSLTELFDRDSDDGEVCPASAGGVGAEGSDARLKAAVAGYMKARLADRPAAEARVRGTYESAREQRRWDAMADTVSALTRFGSSRHPEALNMARALIDPTVAAVLVSRVVAAPADVRGNRIDVLAHLGESAARAVAQELHETSDRGARRVLLNALIRVGPRALGVLEEMVDDGRWFVVRNAVTVLGEAGGDVALQHLTGTVVHEDARVRRETVLSLQKIEDEGAALLVLGRLEDGDPSVRAVAARAVGALQLERGLRPLLEVLDREPDEDVTATICRALGTLGDPSAVPTLEKRATASLFSKPPTRVRVAAYQALSAIGTPHALSLLAQAESDRDPTVRAAVAEARRVRES